MTISKKFWLIFVNLISSVRIFGSLFLFGVYAKHGSETVGIILVLLFATDWVDGYIARKYNVSTFFGSILDSLSDKLIAILSCIILCYENQFAIFGVLIEILIILVNMFVLLRKGNIKSSKIGKAKTWVLSIAIIVGFFFSDRSNTTLNLIISIPLILSELITLIDYIYKATKVKYKVSHKKKHLKKSKDIFRLMFSPEFYEENKNSTNLISNIYK